MKTININWKINKINSRINIEIKITLIYIDNKKIK